MRTRRERREELKTIRQSQAAPSTNLHLLNRKAKALSNKKLGPGTSATVARNTVKEFESYNRLADRVNNDLVSAKTILQNNMSNAQKLLRDARIGLQKGKYRTQDVQSLETEVNKYLSLAGKSLTNINEGLSSVAIAKKTASGAITSVKDWVASGEGISREYKTMRKAKRLASAVSRKKYVVTWVENGKEKSTSFDTAAQYQSFMNRLKKRAELKEIRIGQKKTLQRTGPFADILKKLDKQKEDYLKKMNYSPDDWKGKSSYLDYLIKTRTKGIVPARTEAEKRAQLGWIGANAATAGLMDAPVVVANTAGLVVGGPLGMVFVPLTVAALQWLDRKEHDSYLNYLKKTRTPDQAKSMYKKMLEDHPELYDAMYIQGLTTLSLLYGSSKLGSFIGPSTKQVSMTPQEYAHYRKTHPWSGGMASQMEQDESWIHMLVEGLLDKTKPKSVKWYDTRTTRGIGKYKPYHWQIDEKVFPTLPIDKGYATSPLIWVNILKVGAYNRVIRELRNRGLTEAQIKAIVPTEAEIQAYKLKDISIPDFPNIEDMKNFYLESELLHTMLEQGQLAQKDFKVEQGQQNIQDLMQTQEQIQEQLQELETGIGTSEILEIGVSEIDLPEIPTIPELPKLSKVKESKKTPSEQQDSFTVRFTDYQGRSESHDISANTFQEAYSKAFHIRRWHGLLHEVDIIKRS